MKSAIIYISIHHENTRKIAIAISKELVADLFQVSEVTPILLEQYDLIGFGSGIFFGKHHEKVFELINSIDLSGKNVFTFSTSGIGNVKYNKDLNNILISKGANIKTSFSCKGYDTYGIFKWLGGISKGRPNNRDIEKAKEYVKRSFSSMMAS